MNRKFLVIGKNGQVGTELLRELARHGKVAALDRREVDLAKPDSVRRAIQENRADVIVNAAAYTAVDLAEKEETLAKAINADAPAIMAEEAKKTGALLVHYSTDYVFDGTKKTAYIESDATNPLGAYGRTKLAGEQGVAASGASHLIVRTAWVYGRRGKNFLLTILRLAAEREELRIVEDQRGAPTWCREIARGTASLLEKMLTKPPEEIRSASGIYHVTAGGTASWFDFAKAIVTSATAAKHQPDWLRRATNHRALIVNRVTPIPSSEYPTPAKRPAYSVLSNEKVERDFGVTLPTWEQQLAEVFSGDD